MAYLLYYKFFFNFWARDLQVKQQIHAGLLFSKPTLASSSVRPFSRYVLWQFVSATSSAFPWNDFHLWTNLLLLDFLKSFSLQEITLDDDYQRNDCFHFHGEWKDSSDSMMRRRNVSVMSPIPKNRWSGLATVAVVYYLCIVLLFGWMDKNKYWVEIFCKKFWNAFLVAPSYL